MLLVVGCTTTNKIDHKITYCVNGEVITLNPSTYEEGQEVVLPEPLIEPGSKKYFDGWYLNKNYTGEKVTKIDKSCKDDIVLYGKIKEITNTYTITYYLNGETIDLPLKSYSSGDSIELPKLNIDDATFLGWYLNPEFKGNQVTNTSGYNTNLELYAKVKDEILVKPDLKQALGYQNYTYEFTIKSKGFEETKTYLYDNGDIAYIDFEGDEYNYYLVSIDGKQNFIYNEDGDWYFIDSDDDDFIYYEMMFQVINLANLNDSLFFYDENKNCFTMKEEVLQETTRLFLGYYENEIFTNFQIYLENNMITKIVVLSDYDLDGETINYEYIIDFTNFNNTIIKVPNANPTTNINKIKEVYNLESGTKNITVSGVITGIYGNNFYISDDEKGILVYCGSNSSYVNSFKVGDSVTVTGDVDIYKNIHQLKNITSVISSDKTINPFSITLKNLEQNTLKQYVSDLVNVEGVTLKSLPSSFPTMGSDVSFQVELSGNIVTIFISKHLDSSIKNQLFSYLKQKQIGDSLDLNNLHISYYNEYQLVVTNSSIIEDAYKIGDPIIPVRIITAPEQLLVEQGETIEDILSSISVYVIYNNKIRELLNSNQYTCEHRFVFNSPGEFTFKYEYQGLSANCKVIVSQSLDAFYPEINNQPLYDVLSKMGYDEETGETYGITKGLPSIGSPEVLVIPIAFVDCPAPTNMVNDLQKAFFGTSEETGWESLNSYYLKSSYGKLNIKGTVLEPYNTGKTVSYYNQLQKEYNKALEDYYNYVTDEYPDNVEYSIIKEALNYYDSSIDYSKYDSDGDGYIDSIYFIYTTDYNAEDSESLWWAFTTEYATQDVEYYDNVEADFYIFMSYQFIFDELQGKKVKYNAETIIHETGHLLGLTDYYDYDNTVGPSGGIGGGDMMDYNVGDHNAYSKILLGWVTPLVVSGKSITIDLESFEKSGDCVCIFNNWNGTFFDEYYIIDFYTPTGLNDFAKGNSGLFSISGIRIYHIDATLNDPSECFSIFDVTKYNNTDTTHRLISLVEADGLNDIDNEGASENSDLFQKGDKLSNVKWYDGTKANFTIIVDNITSTKATITITY